MVKRVLTYLVRMSMWVIVTKCMVLHANKLNYVLLAGYTPQHHTKHCNQNIGCQDVGCQKNKHCSLLDETKHIYNLHKCKKCCM